METTYLVKARYCLSGLRVYKVTTDDIYHFIGKLVCNTIERIDDLRYSEWLQEREDFWLQEGYDIFCYDKELKHFGVIPKISDKAII